MLAHCFNPQLARDHTIYSTIYMAGKGAVFLWASAAVNQTYNQARLKFLFTVSDIQIS